MCEGVKKEVFSKHPSMCKAFTANTDLGSLSRTNDWLHTIIIIILLYGLLCT